MGEARPKPKWPLCGGMTDESRDRPAPISYRPPKGREAEFAALVEASGLSVNAFITQSAFGRRRSRVAERKQLALLLATAARISDQLHEVSLAGRGDSALSEAVHQELIE